MSDNAAATRKDIEGFRKDIIEGVRKDIEDVLEVIGAMMSRIDERFNAVEKRLDTKADKTDTDRIIGLLDRHEKRIEIIEDEKRASDHQLDRHERWIQELANKVDHRLSA